MTPDRLDEIASGINLITHDLHDNIVLTGNEMLEIVELALDGMTLRCDKMEVDLNRDYFVKPIQGSRSQHDYGKMGRIEPMATTDSNWRAMAYGLIAGVLIVGIIGWVL